MKRRTFIAGAISAPVPVVAAGAVVGEISEPEEEDPIERLRKAMSEIRDILQQSAPEGAVVDGIVWGGPLGPGVFGAWVHKDGNRLKFYDRKGKTDIHFE